MEAAAQERELQLLQLQEVSWPFHAMEAASSSWDASSSSSSGGDCFLLGWEPPFGGCLGVLATAGADVHSLLPLYMEELPASLPPAPPPPQQDAVALPEELDDLLLNFWDASSEQQQQQQQQQQVAFNSSCVLQEKTSSTTATATTPNSNSNFFYDDDDLLGSIFSTGPTLTEKGVAEPLLSSSSSNCQADPQVSEVSGAQPQATPAPSGARAPPCPARCSSSSSSLKRAAPADTAEAEYCSQSSSKRRRETETTTTPEKAKAASASACRVLCPFAVLKPDGLDGGATLADINARILMRPSRPVRHPVGEFACAPRVSADKPGLSGKTVSGFTRLHTPGRGTITIIRTRG